MSFQTGLSGLRAATADLNTTGNNIANAGTTGFKQARTEFGDVYAASLSSSGSRVIGSGVTLLRVAQQYNQGTISLTRRPLDVAINGGGFFVLDDGGSRVYTRAGVFGIDKDGFLVSNTNSNLVGYIADDAGNIDLGNETLMRVQAFNLPPNRTTEVEMGFNLDATAAAPDPTLFGDFDPTDQRTFNHASSLTVFDSEGMPHVATLYFRKDQPDPAIETGVNNDWSVWVSLDGELVNDNPANLTIPPATDPVASNTTNALIGNAVIANQALYTTTYANEYQVQFVNPAQYNVIARNTVTGATSTLASNVAYVSGGNIAAIAATGGVNVAITNGVPPVAPLAGDTFFVRPAIPADPNQRATAFRVQFNTDGSLNGTPPAGFVTSLVIDDWVPALQVQSVFDSNAEPDGPNSSAATPVFNGVVDAGFSDFVIDIAGSTQFGDDFNIGFLRQDGFGPGQLVGTEISENGVLFARYTNGRSLTLGQILLADFQNQQGLTPIGNTSWAESFDSGQPIPGLAGSGAFGTLQSGALEESNVDLTEELVDLIVAQRNFQANAKTIETNNAITQTVINIRS